MKSKKTLKTLIIGLDGATFDLLLPFVESKKLPVFEGILKESAWGELQSTIPPVTAAAWPSFMTGENPGKHGILNFIQTAVGKNSNLEDSETVTTKNFSGRTFFDVMSNNNFRVGVITVPVTYPPWDVNGIMISGYPCPDNSKIYQVSSDINFEISQSLNFSAEYYKTSSEDEILEDCLDSDRQRAKLAFDLLDRYAFDSFVLILGGIDRAQHDYWKYFDDHYPGVRPIDRKKYRSAIFRNYKLADDIIGEFLDRFGSNSNIFIVSDHGAGKHPFKMFNLNLWLKKNDLLKIKRSRNISRECLRKLYHKIGPFILPKKRRSSLLIEKIRPVSKKIGGGMTKLFRLQDTKAFHYPMNHPAGGIVLNVKDRQADGSINSGLEFHNLVLTIMTKLSEFRDPQTGVKVIQKIFRREDLYEGPYISNFPDIIYLLAPEYTTGRELFGKIISAVPQVKLLKTSGLHLMNGIFIAHGPRIRNGYVKNAQIIDIAPSILYCCGLPIPDNMDGKVLESIFKEEFFRNNPVQFCKFEGQKINRNVILNEKENSQIKEKLKSLGYID